MGILECMNLKKQKGDFVLNSIDFSVEPGCVLGVIGRNGAGKTTLLRLLLGSYRLDEGEICLNGVSAQSDIKAYKKQLAYVLNETPFPVSMTPWECGLFYGPYYNGFDRENYSRLLYTYDVPAKRKIRTLSKGQQIRQQLAFALSYNAAVYLFDEPAANMDVEFRDGFYESVRKITADSGKSVIYVSHLVDELEQLADYILWISEGMQRYFGTIDDLRESYQLVQAARREVDSIEDVLVVGRREREMHQEILVKGHRESLPESVREYSRFASLKEIMYYTERGDDRNAADL